MAGRFKLVADEHWSKGHIKAVRSAGWDVVRLVDVDELGQGTLDPEVLAVRSVGVEITQDAESQSPSRGLVAGHHPEATARLRPGVAILFCEINRMVHILERAQRPRASRPTAAGHMDPLEPLHLAVLNARGHHGRLRLRELEGCQLVVGVLNARGHHGRLRWSCSCRAAAA